MNKRALADGPPRLKVEGRGNLKNEALWAGAGAEASGSAGQDRKLVCPNSWLEDLLPTCGLGWREANGKKSVASRSWTEPVDWAGQTDQVWSQVWIHRPLF